MLSDDLEIDPVVEILRLAYRRGLALRQEQAKANAEAINSARGDKPTAPEVLQPAELQVQAGN